MKRIKDFLKKPEPPCILVQAKVERDLVKRFRLKLKHDKVRLREFVTAAMKAYLEEK